MRVENIDGKESEPVDLDHLDRQTLGDRKLRDEVLALFVREVEKTSRLLAVTGTEERVALAHKIKGAARGVGAGAVAAAAEALEAEPGRMQLVDALLGYMDEAARFIAGLQPAGDGTLRPG